MKKDIRAYTYEQLAAEMEQIGEKKFRAKQIYEWLHVKLADSFEEMTNLSKALREKLEAEYEILPVKMLERQISKIDATNKFLFQLSDGNVVESVLMRYKHGNSVCISSQVGCRMGCRFCASTIFFIHRIQHILDQNFCAHRHLCDRFALFFQNVISHDPDFSDCHNFTVPFYLFFVIF